MMTEKSPLPSIAPNRSFIAMKMTCHHAAPCRHPIRHGTDKSVLPVQTQSRNVYMWKQLSLNEAVSSCTTRVDPNVTHVKINATYVVDFVSMANTKAKTAIVTLMTALNLSSEFALGVAAS